MALAGQGASGEEQGWIASGSVRISGQEVPGKALEQWCRFHQQVLGEVKAISMEDSMDSFCSMTWMLAFYLKAELVTGSQAEDADVVLVAYGISSRISKEAVNMARAEGFKLGLIRPITLWPYPVKAFETCKNAKAFMTVEINILGQMVDDVKLAVENKYPVGFYGTFFGLPEPEEIVAQAKAMLEKEGK